MYKLTLFKNIFDVETILMPDLLKNWHKTKNFKTLKSIYSDCFWGHIFLRLDAGFGLKCLEKTDKMIRTNLMIISILNNLAKRRTLNNFEKEIFKIFIKDEIQYKLTFTNENNKFYKDYVIDRISKIEDYGELNVTCKILKETLDFYTFYFKKHEEYKLTDILEQLVNINCGILMTNKFGVDLTKQYFK